MPGLKEREREKEKHAAVKKETRMNFCAYEAGGY